MLKIIVEFLFVSMCSFLAQGSVIDWLQAKNIIGTGVSIVLLKNICLLISIVATFLFFSLPKYRLEKEAAILQKQRDALIRRWKDMFLESLDPIGIPANVNIRIFVPEKYSRLKEAVFKRKYFVIRNYPFFAENDETTPLKFMVSPKEKMEGLVGQCYNTKQIASDYSLYETNKTKYNLKESQKLQTNRLKMSIVCPVFKMDSEDKIIGMIAMDCNNRIDSLQDETNRERFEREVATFSQRLGYDAPELFSEGR